MNEVWKDIIGYEGLYQVSDLGRVKSLSRTSGVRTLKEKILSTKKNANGYCHVELKKGITKTFKVHRLVALMFLENKEGKLCVNHKNSIRDDNIVENLEWCTYKENAQHALKLGRMKFTPPRGILNGKSKLTEKEILTIRSLTIPKKQIAKIYNIAVSTVYSINNRNRWAHV